MSITGILVGVLVFTIFIGLIVVVIAMKKNNTNFVEMFGGTPIDENTFDSDKAENVINILPIKDISNNAMLTHDNRLVGYVCVQSLNIRLKTNAEQDVIEESFKEMLSVINCSFDFFISTKNLDTENIVESARDNVENTLQSFPNLKSLSDQFLSAMENYSSNMGVYKKKEKYIILSIDLHGDQFDDDLEEHERIHQGLVLLNEICNLVMGSIASIGIPGSFRLNSEQIASLFGSTFHRDSNAIPKYLSEYSANLVDGRLTPFGTWNEEAPGNPYAALRLWLHMVQERLSNDVFNNNSISESDKYELVEYMKALKVMKDNLAKKSEIMYSNDFEEGDRY